MSKGNNMSSIKDFTELMETDVKPLKVKPEINMDDFEFVLLDVELVYKWIQSGEFKDDGTPKWIRDEQPKTDETGSRAYVKIGFQIIDENGRQTSFDAPFVDDSHCVTLDELKTLKNSIGNRVKFNHPRITFFTKSVAQKNGFTKLETQLKFEFDSFDFDK